MLKINLLTVVRDAEREYRKMLDDQPCDYLTMFEDLTVRRRVHQNTRNNKTAAIKRARKDQMSRDRRAGMSAVGSTFLGANGEQNLDVRKPPKTVGKDRPYGGKIKHNHHHEPDNIEATRQLLRSKAVVK